MRLRKKSAAFQEGDMTPMIDMVFQLIAFFMVLVNFSDADQDERVKLPSSELAKPPDVAFESPLTVQLTKEGTVLFGGSEVSIPNLEPLLLREGQFLDRANKGGPAAATVIIRAHADVATGKVQKVIEVCQKTRFEKFALRAKQEEVH